MNYRYIRKYCIKIIVKAVNRIVLIVYRPITKDVIRVAIILDKRKFYSLQEII